MSPLTDFSPELLFALGLAVVAFLAGMLYLRAQANRTRTRGVGGSRRAPDSPPRLRYTCAGCSGQFTHSRKTLAEREAGARSFLCKACRTRQRMTQSARPR